MFSISKVASESRARRAAVRCGYVARKSRCRQHSTNNFGGFIIVDPANNIVVAGARYDLEPQEVIDWCKVESD